MIITAGDSIDHYGVLQRPYIAGVKIFATVKNMVLETIVVDNEEQITSNDNGNIGITLDIDTTGWVAENAHELELRLEYASGVKKTADNTIRIDVRKPLSATCPI